jgi:hypothetical protein
MYSTLYNVCTVKFNFKDYYKYFFLFVCLCLLGDKLKEQADL